MEASSGAVLARTESVLRGDRVVRSSGPGADPQEDRPGKHDKQRDASGRAVEPGGARSHLLRASCAAAAASGLGVRGGLAGLARDECGVVYVELLSVIFVVLLLFLGTMQIAELATARLVVRRAASAAARAAAVVLPDDPAHYAGSSELQDLQVRMAAAMVLRAAPQTRLQQVRVELQGTRGNESNVRVEVEAGFRCGLRMLCPPNGQRTLRQTSVQAYQGARYAYGR